MRGRPITAEEFERMLAAVDRGLLSLPRKKDKRTARRAMNETARQKLDQLRSQSVEARVPVWGRLLTGLWLSGLRLGEALALSWDDDAAVAVHLAGKYPKLRIWAEAEKAHTDRLLPITPDFAQFLLATPEADRRGLVFGICGRGGLPMDVKAAGRVVSAIGKAAGVVVSKEAGKYASAHDLRRAFGTRWAKRVMPATLQKLMRHAAIETTLTHYVELNADDVSADLWAAHTAGNISGNTPAAGGRASGSVENAQPRSAVGG
jgi:integrase